MAYSPITKSTDYFNTKLYTGNSSTQSITGVGFQPDWVSIKDRDATNSFMTFDAVRGATQLLNWNTTNTESTQTPTLTSFNSDGFSIGNNTALNTNGNDLVAWNWKANGAGSANTAGSINSTVSVSTTSGFSIVSYSGTGSLATVGHGLGVKPKMIIVRKRNSAENWLVYNEKLTASNYLLFNSTGASGADNMWNSTEPTSSVFTVNAVAGANGSGGTYIAYCFNDVQGFSKMGSYSGNGSDDGTFVYTGFKPAWVMLKVTNAVNDWIIMDNKRTTFNPMGEELKANSNGVASTNTRWDQVSNGFKLRNTGDAVNGSGKTYIYMAFAEEPLVASNYNVATAR